MNRKRNLLLFAITMVFAFGFSLESSAQHRRVVVRNRPHRTTLVVRTGHPIRRRLPATVVVRQAHRAVVVGAPLVFLPGLRWTASVVTLPARDRLAWQDSEVIESDEGWVDTNFGIDSSGNALFLEIDGKAELNFAEITFANGNVQVVDFNEETHGKGIYKLLDFADGRHVKTVRILALSKSEDTKLNVYLSK
ncbi:MAG TPA: hypothetical protein VGV87_12665 [Blastocatellia bacterium]|nr:hypothetical protein [Blastocatellia bacterium]